ncbi:MAG: hypothetical protein L7S70_06280 [Pseudomonadales bacterium]|nr:hypothetical protein [Pseudomonadales bacterium]
MAVNYDGFAQGFQGGFGLMQDAIANQRANELEQARLEETKRQNNLSYDIRQRQLGIEQQLAEVEKLVGGATARRTNALAGTEEATGISVAEAGAAANNAAARRTNALAGTEEETGVSLAKSEIGVNESVARGNNARADTEEQTGVRSAEADISATEAGARLTNAQANTEEETGVDSEQSAIDLRNAQTDSLSQETEIAGRTDLQVRGAEALQLMMGTAQDVINGDATTDQFSELLELNKDTITAAGFVFDPSFDITLANFKKDLADGNFDGSSGVDLLNAVARSSNKFNIGAMVDKTFVNAPPEFRSGGFRVVSSEFMDFRQVEGGITGTILNVVEDADGNQFMYTSPNTAGRNTADGTPLVLEVNGLMASLSAVTQMRGQMGGLKSQMKEAAQIARYGKGEQGQNDFMADVQAEVDRYDAIATNDPDRRSPIPNMTMQEFVDNPTVMTDYIENGVLFDYENQTFGRENYDMLMEATRNSEDAQIIANQLGGDALSPKELESIQVIRPDAMTKAERRKVRQQIYRRLLRNRIDMGIPVGRTSVKGRPD